MENRRGMEDPEANSAAPFFLCGSLWPIQSKAQTITEMISD